MKKKEPKPPKDHSEVMQYFIDKGYFAKDAERFIEYYEAGSWRDKNGDPVLNWKQKAIINWFPKMTKRPPEKVKQVTPELTLEQIEQQKKAIGEMMVEVSKKLSVNGRATQREKVNARWVSTCCDSRTRCVVENGAAVRRCEKCGKPCGHRRIEG